MGFRTLGAAALLLSFGLTGQAEEEGAILVPFERVETPEDAGAIPLYDGEAPGSEGSDLEEVWRNAGTERWANNVTRPTLLPVLPEDPAATRAAVSTTFSTGAVGGGASCLGPPTSNDRKLGGLASSAAAAGGLSSSASLGGGGGGGSSASAICSTMLPTTTSSCTTGARNWSSNSLAFCSGLGSGDHTASAPPPRSVWNVPNRGDFSNARTHTTHATKPENNDIIMEELLSLPVFSLVVFVRVSKVVSEVVTLLEEVVNKYFNAGSLGLRRYV